MSNNRLPIDVLEEIFYHYQAQEDIFYPLETLLLVCKFWSIAALSCPGLWGRFTIRITHEPVITMWKARIPLRLARSGTFSPIDISIHTSLGRVRLPMNDYHRELFSPQCLNERYSFDTRSCPCLDERQHFVALAVELLAGSTGEQCERWRTLDLKFGHWKYRIDPLQSGYDGILIRGLTYPTPALKVLRIDDVTICDTTPGSNYRLLPFTPVVEDLETLNTFLPEQPFTPMARKVRITTGTGKHYLTSPKHVNLEGSNLIEELRVRIGTSGIRLPSDLPCLTRLTIDSAGLPEHLKECQMSRLQYLSLDIGHFGTAHKLVLDCPNFPFGQIHQLNFRLNDIYHWGYKMDELQASILEILRRAATNLTSLHSLEVIHALVLKWLWEYRGTLENSGTFGQGPGLYFQKKVVLSTESSKRELSGDESCKDLERFALELGIMSPSNSWDILISALDKMSLSMSSGCIQIPETM